MFTYRINVSFNKLLCHHPGKRSAGGAKPYMWCIFFKVDGEGIVVADNFKLAGQAAVHFSKGSHNNLKVAKVEAGATVNIPPEVGQWTTNLVPLRLPYFETDFPGIIGVVGVLLKQGSVSNGGIEAGRIKLSQFILAAIEKSINEFDPRQVDVYNLETSIRAYFRRSVEAMSSGTEQVILRAVVGSQNIIQNLRSLLNRDALVGFKVWDFNHTDIALNHGHLTFSERWTDATNGDWEVQGSLKAEITQAQIPFLG